MIQFTDQPQPESLNSLPSYRWRIPACLVGFADLIYSTAYIYVFLSWLYNEYYFSDETEFLKEKTWLLIGIIGAAIYIPFCLLAIYYSIGLIAVTIRKPQGGLNENYTAGDEAEINFRYVWHWRYYNLAALVLALTILIVSIIFSWDWIKALVHCAVLCVLLVVVKQHLEEIQAFIKLQDQREKLSIRRRSKALMDMLQLVDEPQIIQCHENKMEIV